MKIGFVAEPYETTHASGMGYSVMETMRALARISDIELVIYSSQPIDRSLVPGEYTNSIIPKSFVGQFLYFFFTTPKVDALLFIVALLPFWISKSVPTVLICKELTNQHLPAERLNDRIKIFIRDRVLLPRCIRNCLLILASSESTKFDLEKYYGVPPEKIELIFEGYQDWSRYKEVAPPGDPALTPYFLFSGKVKPRKNVHALVDAFIDLRENTNNTSQLVIAGSYGGEYYEHMQEALRRHHLEDSVHFLGYVDAPMMYTLYTNALAYVFPSLNEGFGMPLIEAMSLGLPVVTSNISAMTEVVGDAGLLVDPQDTSAIRKAMERMINDAPLRESLRAKGFIRSKDFSWEKVGERYREILKSLENKIPIRHTSGL